MTLSPSQQRRRRCRYGKCLMLAGCLLVAGCGVQQYEQQLNNSNELFTYQNRLNQVLTRDAWSAPGYGISMRIPLGYGKLRDPEPVAPMDGEKDTGEPAESPVDERQPTYLGVEELEGLIAAWKAIVPTRDTSNAQVYLYVLGNHDRMLNGSPTGEGAPPDKYLEDLEALLGLQLGLTIEPPGSTANEPNARFQESLPRDGKFVRSKEFDVVRLVPSDSALQDLGLSKHEAYLYEHRAGSIQVAILLMAPASAKDNPDTVLRIALETLSVSSQAPQRQADGQVGQPAGPAGF